MRVIAGLGSMVALALLQVTWAPRLDVAGAFPNLVLLAVVATAWTFGVRAALVWACVGGVLLDLTASGPIGPHALALLAGAYAIGFATRSVEHPTAIHAVLSAAVSTVLYSAVLVLATGLAGLPMPDAGAAVRLIGAASVYNALLMPLAIELLRRLRALTPEAGRPALGTISRRVQA